VRAGLAAAHSQRVIVGRRTVEIAKGSLVIGLENECAPRFDGNRIEDALVILARDYTGLMTF